MTGSDAVEAADETARPGDAVGTVAVLWRDPDTTIKWLRLLRVLDTHRGSFSGGPVTRRPRYRGVLLSTLRAAGFPKAGP